MQSDVLEKFLKYVKIDTQSSYGAECYPSTEKQKDMLLLLVDELKALGLPDVVMDQYGYVTATLPSNIPDGHPAQGKVPIIGFIGHVDTSPDVSGTNVSPIIHENYDGGDLVLPGDTSIVIKAENNPYLSGFKGSRIITSDGTTLLGADDKAGTAEIMAALGLLVADPSLLHGDIKVAFTPDEEVGNGTKYFDVEAFGADLAYTMDGDVLGSIETENFNASGATITIKGVNHHPGTALNKMVNSLRIAGRIVAALPEDMAPETTRNREGFIHPNDVCGDVSSLTIKLIVRDFELNGLKQKEALIEKLVDAEIERNPRAKIELKIEESYLNMRMKIEERPDIVENAMEAVRRAGLEPIRKPIRGGTDGARLSFMGLPTPNIFTGGHNFHSKLEYIPVDAMDKAVEVIVELCKLYVERA